MQGHRRIAEREVKRSSSNENVIPIKNLPCLLLFAFFFLIQFVFGLALRLRGGSLSVKEQQIKRFKNEREQNKNSKKNKQTNPRGGHRNKPPVSS
jgi:hypothetical protein